MSETEFDILDELYFVTSYPDLKSTLSLNDEALCSALQSLIRQGFVKILYPDQDTAYTFDAAQFESQCRAYYYLATKAGLVAHNTI